MGLAAAGRTDVGRRRDHNEDSLLVDLDHGLCVVADGMGGHQAGEVASRLAVEVLEELFARTNADPEATWPLPRQPGESTTSHALRLALRAANQRIFNAAGESGRQGMGTTCVAACVESDGRGAVAWVGDSRAYRWRDGFLLPLTEDHSLVNELIAAGRLSPDSASRYPYRNVITRALGTAGDVEVDVEPFQLQSGDLLLLCSDGLNGMLEDEAIGALLADAAPLPELCDRLVDAANAAGGNDNITVVLMRWSSDD